MQGNKRTKIYAHEVEYMICMHEKKKPDDPPIYFKIQVEPLAVKVTMPTLGKFTFGGLVAFQFGVNDNIATTCHKLQGVSVEQLVIDSFNYKMENWIYVVLSRVTTRNGLVLCEKLSLEKDYKVNEVLVRWEEEMHSKFEIPLFILRGQYEEYMTEQHAIETE